MASDANSPWVHLVQDTAGMANLTPSTPFPSGIKVTLPNSRFFCSQDHCKMEKTAPPMQTTSQFILIKHSHFGSNHGTSAIHQQHQTIPHYQAIASTSILAEIAQELTKIHPIKLEPSPTPPKIHLGHTLPVRKQLLRLHHPPTTPNDSSPPGFCPHFNSCGNHLRTRKDTSNQARALSHTSQNTHRSNINISEEITAPPPSTVNSKQSFTIKLLPTLQLSRKLLENLQRYTQSSASLPPHLPQFTSIEHCHFGSNHGAAAATQRYTTVLHNQAIDSTPFFAEIVLEVTARRFTQSSTSPPPHHPKFTSITHCHFGNNHGTAAIHRQHQMIPHHQAIGSTPILAEIA
jgi:hypothetical protein